VPLVFYVVILWKFRNPQAIPAQLPQLLENNFGASVVFFDRAVHFDHLILQLTHIANAFQVVRKNHHGERTNHGILAEIEKCDTAAGVLHAKDFAGNTLVLTDVLSRLGNGNAIGGSRQNGKKQSDEKSAEKPLTRSCAKLDLENEHNESIPYVTIVGRVVKIERELAEKNFVFSRNRKRQTKSRSRSGPALVAHKEGKRL